jgi:hypothetical protein
VGRRSVDPLPPVELWGEDATEEAPRRVEAGGRGSRRTPLLVAVTLAVALLGGLALGDETSGPTQGDKDERDNAARVPLKDSTTTTSRPRPTTTAPAPPVPILPGSGVRLVLTRSGGSAEVLDLETGATSDIGLTRNEVYGVVAVRGGVVAIEGGNAIYMPLPTGISVPLGHADQVLSSGDPDRVWLVVPSADPYVATSQAVLVNLSGQTLAGPIGPDEGFIAGAVPGGLIAQAGGRIYLIEGSGRVRPIVAGEVLGVSDNRLLARICDDQAACALTVWDADLKGSHAVEAPGGASGYYGSTVVVEPGGSRAALQSFGPSGTVLSIVDLAGGPPLRVDVFGEISGLAWLPGDLGLVVAQQSRLVRVHIEGDHVVIDMLRDRGADFVAVIP